MTQAVGAEEQLDEQASQLGDFVARHPRLLVLTGAGCSVESGIPAYRDHDAQWRVRTPIRFQEFVRDEAAQARYWARSMVGYPIMARAQANPVHHWLAMLEAEERLTLLATQNVDGLHQRAGSRRVVELHGRIADVVCLECSARYARSAIQQRLESLNPGLVGVAAGVRPDGDAELEPGFLHGFRIPRCDSCGGRLKPAVVMFGENVPRDRVTATMAALDQADALLVLGSSLMVFSAYRFCRAATQLGRPMAAVTMGRTRADAELSLKIEAPCGALCERLGSPDL